MLGELLDLLILEGFPKLDNSMILCGMLGVNSVLLVWILSEIHYSSFWEQGGGFCSSGPSRAVSQLLLQILQVCPRVQGPISSSEASVSWQPG